MYFSLIRIHTTGLFDLQPTATSGSISKYNTREYWTFIYTEEEHNPASLHRYTEHADCFLYYFVTLTTAKLPQHVCHNRLSEEVRGALDAYRSVSHLHTDDIITWTSDEYWSRLWSLRQSTRYVLCGEFIFVSAGNVLFCARFERLYIDFLMCVFFCSQECSSERYGWPFNLWMLYVSDVI